MSDMDVGVVDVRIFWVPPARSPSGRERQDGLIVVHRVMACGPEGASRQRLPIPEAPDKVLFAEFGVGMPETEGGRAGYTREHYFLDAFDDYMAKKLVGPAWKKSSEIWVTPVCEDTAAVAERLSGFHDQWHDLVLGQPVQYLTGSTPLANIATELTLPGDEWFAGTKRLVQIGGILFGLASGQPLLVNACLKSLVHDVLLKAVSKEIGSFLINTLEQVGTCERDLETAPAKEALEQQITDLKELLRIARDKEVEREKAEYEEVQKSDEDDGPFNPQEHAPSGRIAAGRDLHSQKNQLTPTNERSESENEKSDDDRDLD